MLGWLGPSGFKAIKGSIVHKVLEVLAKIKLAQQTIENHLYGHKWEPIKDIPYFIEDDICGNIDINNLNINTITEQVYDYYTQPLSEHIWTVDDFRDCKLWVEKVLDLNNGQFNPLNSYIISPEQHFDIILYEPWAAYDFQYQGQKLTGLLSLKGTIDLVTKVDDKTLEIVDYKTGKRLDWATGEEKTHEKLMTDFQLRLYHLAGHSLYPDIENIVVTIIYINDGGAFSLCFSKDEIENTKRIIRSRFEEIGSCNHPKLNKTWKCSKLCHYGKTTFENTSIKPLVEFREGQIAQKGEIMKKCDQIDLVINRDDINKTIENYSNSTYNINTYTNS